MIIKGRDLRCVKCVSKLSEYHRKDDTVVKRNCTGLPIMKDENYCVKQTNCSKQYKTGPIRNTSHVLEDYGYDRIATLINIIIMKYMTQVIPKRSASPGYVRP